MMKTRKLSNSRMARFWAARLAELESMRPITAAEAITEAEAAEAEAAILQEEIDQVRRLPNELETWPTLQRHIARDIGAARASVWGHASRILTLRMRASAMRRVAAQAEGEALHASIAEARRRAEHYAALVGSKTHA